MLVTMPSRRGLVNAVVLVTLGFASLASAQQRPWADGVSEADQARAKQLLEDGNKLLDQGALTEALELYDDAIKIWDHPAIRYNIAVAKIKQDQPFEAWRQLERALRYGAAALEPDVYQQALDYRRLLAKQIVHLTIECVDPGTHVTLDKTDVAVSCPGSTTELIAPGGHKLVATKSGSVPKTIDLAPAGGESPHERIDLMTIEEATVIRHRWARYKPWVVVGAGVAVAGVGLGFELQSAATFRSYDHAVATLCGDTPCTGLPAVVTDAYEDGRRQNRIAIGFFAAGGATIATGAVLLWLNRARRERIGYDQVPAVTASVGSRASLIAARWSF
jgi:hypothetical protein